MKKYEDISIIDAPFLANDREHLVRILESDSVTEVFDDMPKKSLNSLGGLKWIEKY